MSSDIRIKSKPKTTENALRNKSAKKKEEISILPWDIEHFEEDFEI